MEEPTEDLSAATEGDDEGLQLPNGQAADDDQTVLDGDDVDEDALGDDVDVSSLGPEAEETSVVASPPLSRLRLSPGEIKKKIMIVKAFDRVRWQRERKHLQSCGVQITSERPTAPIPKFASCPTGRWQEKRKLHPIGGRAGIAIIKAAAEVEAEVLGQELIEPTEADVNEGTDQQTAIEEEKEAKQLAIDEVRVERMKDHLLKVQEGQLRAMQVARAAAQYTAELALAQQRLKPSVADAQVQVLRGWTRDRRFLIDYSYPRAAPMIPASAAPGAGPRKSPGATKEAATAATVAALAVLRGEGQQDIVAKNRRPKPPPPFGRRADGGQGEHRRLVGFRELRNRRVPPGIPPLKDPLPPTESQEQVESSSASASEETSQQSPAEF
jgi:hypothetical protein